MKNVMRDTDNFDNEIDALLNEEQQLSDAYLEQEAFHKELDLAFQLMESEQARRFNLKQSSFVLLIVCLGGLGMDSMSKTQLFLMYTICQSAILTLDCMGALKANRYRWLYEWTCIQRQSGDNTLRYNLNANRFIGYESALVSLLEFDCVPFYVVLWLSTSLFFIGV